MNTPKEHAEALKALKRLETGHSYQCRMSPKSVCICTYKADSDLVEAALSAQQAGWQDIETCPENVSVLIYIEWDHYGPGVMRAIKVPIHNDPGRYRWHTTAWACGRDLDPDLWPKKWQPLPSPPAEGK